MYDEFKPESANRVSRTIYDFFIVLSFNSHKASLHFEYQEVYEIEILEILSCLVSFSLLFFS